MRRTISVLLCFVIVLALCSCGKSNVKKSSTASSGITDKFAGQYRVGYGRTCITPDYSVPLAGFGNTWLRMSQGYLDDLYITTIAYSDKDDNTVLFIDFDNVGCAIGLTGTFRAAISKETGIPLNNIMVTATHTHSAPACAYTNTDKSPSINQYMNDDLPRWFVMSAKAALNDRTPIEKMSVGSIEATGLSFVRHYYDVDGVCFGNNHNSIFHSTVVKHTTDVDPTMYMVKFDRKEGKAPVAYISWRAHATRTGAINTYDISADLPGVIIDELKESTGILAAYFQGASGNVNPTSEMPDETVPSSYIEHGKKLAEFAETLSKNLTTVEPGSVKTSKVEVKCQINHTTDSMKGQAALVSSCFKSTNDPHEAMRVGRQYGIYSPYHANAIMNRALMGQFENVPLNCVSISESIAFAYAPYEMFDTNSVQIEDGSSYDFTIVSGYSNGKVGYIPSSLGFEYGCYEADCTRYLSGTGEKLAESLIKDINSLRK